MLLTEGAARVRTVIYGRRGSTPMRAGGHQPPSLRTLVELLDAPPGMSTPSVARMDEVRRLRFPLALKRGWNQVCPIPRAKV